MVSRNKPLISVILASKNEEKKIEGCLKSLQRQTIPKKNLEIILVDFGSKDKTVELARKFVSRFCSLKIFLLKKYVNLDKIKNFRGAQINLGVKKSRGEIIFLPDVDMTHDQDLLAEIIKKIEQYDALYVPEVILGKGFLGKIRNFERSFYSETPVDAVRVVKKEIFNKVGGYDEKNIIFGADDWDLTKSIKKVTQKVSITRNRLYHHEESLDWKTFLIKKKKYANCFDGYIKKWGENDPDVKKQLGLWYRSVVVFTEQGKWRRLITNPVLALSMYFLRFFTWLSFKINK